MILKCHKGPIRKNCIILYRLYYENENFSTSLDVYEKNVILHTQIQEYSVCGRQVFLYKSNFM